MARFVQQANAAGVQVVLSGLSEKLRFSWRGTSLLRCLRKLWLESNADHGLERCEDLIIAAWNTDAATMERHASLLEHTVDDLERYLERRVRFEDLIETLRPWLIPKSYPAEDVIAGPDVPSEGLQLLLSGHASVYDSAGLRLRQCGPGDVIWPSNPAGDMETTVVADESCSIMLLTPTPGTGLRNTNRDWQSSCIDTCLPSTSELRRKRTHLRKKHPGIENAINSPEPQGARQNTVKGQKRV